MSQRPSGGGHKASQKMEGLFLLDYGSPSPFSPSPAPFAPPLPGTLLRHPPRTPFLGLPFPAALRRLGGPLRPPFPLPPLVGTLTSHPF